MWRAYRSLADGDTRQAFLRTLRAVVDPGGQSISAVDRLYLAAAVPTQIVWGDRDPIIPVSHAHRAHEAMPGSRLEVLEGVGHFPQVEEPALLAEVLSRFIDETEPAARSAADFRDLLAPPA
jgi:pimeloyl-ACP methyl ester carboxylesterase